MTALEPRVLLAGDAGQAVESAAAESTAEVACETSMPIRDASLADSGRQIDSLPTTCADSVSADIASADIVFIDSRVDDIDALTTGLQETAEFVLIDAEHNAVKQISAHLSQRHSVRSLHIVSHATAGELILGSQKVDVAHLNQNKQLISDWSQSLLPEADIVIYGCEAGKGRRGESFAHRLATLTGADVAISVDRTGTVDQADWEFELHVGLVESPIVFSALSQQNYRWTLSLSTEPLQLSDVENAASTSLLSTDAAGREPLTEDANNEIRDQSLNGNQPADDRLGLLTAARVARVDQQVLDLNSLLPPDSDIVSHHEAQADELPLESAERLPELELLSPTPQSESPQRESPLVDTATATASDSQTAPLVADIQNAVPEELIPARAEIIHPIPATPFIEESIPMQDSPSSLRRYEPMRPLSLVPSVNASQATRGLSRPLIASNAPLARSRLDSSTLDLTQRSFLPEIQPSIIDTIPNSDETAKVHSKNKSNVVRKPKLVAKPERVPSRASTRIRVIDTSVSANSGLAGEMVANTIDASEQFGIQSNEAGHDEIRQVTLSDQGRGFALNPESDEVLSSRSGSYKAWAELKAMTSDANDMATQFADSNASLRFAASTQSYVATFARVATEDFSSANEIECADGSKQLGQLESRSAEDQRDSGTSVARLSHVNTLPTTVTVHSVGQDTLTFDSVDDGQSTTLICDKALHASVQLLDAFSQPQRLAYQTNGSDGSDVQLTTSYLNPLRQYQAAY